jgi:RHS repeat-associated protein
LYQVAVPYNIRFPGQYYDSETGLSQDWNRDYDPVVGRYIESDPIGLLGGLNTYAYALDDPLFNTDPRGLSSCGDKPCDCNDQAEKARKKCVARYFFQPTKHLACIQKFAAKKEACIQWQAAGHTDCPMFDEKPDDTQE